MTLEFTGICLVTFLASCNLTVYYNLFTYLSTLKIPAELCGMVIGVYSLTAMVLYVTASPFLNSSNAIRIMLLGMVILVFSGFGYFFATSLTSLILLRILIGVGHFCIGSGSMTLLMSVIPAGKSGQAFSIYSVAFLVSYGCIPAIMDALAPIIPTPPHGYAAVSLTLLPAAGIVMLIRRRQLQLLGKASKKGEVIAWKDIRTNLSNLPVLLLIFLNMCYFASWSSLFYLFKGFALKQGIANVGIFFSVQTGLMIVMRVLAGRFFDAVSKARLVGGAFITIAAGYLILDHLPGVWAVPWVGFLFGLGTGIGYPALNGLMFQVSAPHLRPMNANLMMFAVQSGFFLGPVLGGALVARHDYHGYFMSSAVVSIVATTVSARLAYHENTP